MTYITGSQNTALLDRLVEANKATDRQIAEDDARRLRERNDEIFQRAVRRFFGIEDR